MVSYMRLYYRLIHQRSDNDYVEGGVGVAYTLLAHPTGGEEPEPLAHMPGLSL